MGYWQLSYNGGARQDAAAWGIDSFKRRRESARTDTVTFSLPGADFTTGGPFAYKSQITIYANGVPWFYGWVSKPARKGSGHAESLEYELSGPWWWVERTPFQQMWVTNNVAGNVATQVTTAQSSIIFGQSLSGGKLHSGQVILEALLYAQYAFLGQAFPAEIITVEPTGARPSYWPSNVPGTFFIGLAAPPTPGAGQQLPFQIGTISPDIATTFSQLRDKPCADLVRLAMRYTPDAVAWVDYTTTPPTLNVDRRGNLGGKTISAEMNSGENRILGEFNPTPRYDLIPSTVLVKYQKTDNVQGVQRSILDVDQYPAGVPDNDPFAVIFTTDLVGGHTTSQSASVVTRPRPIAAGDAIALDWIFQREPWFKLNPIGNTGSYIFDWGAISIVFLETKIDDTDPLNGSNPNGVTLPACPQLVNELLSAFPSWLQENNQLDSADVMVEVWLRYNNNSATTAAALATKQYFRFDPANPSVPLTDGTGYYIGHYAVKATNADTESYSRITSYQASEPVPQGVAEYLYNCLKDLHWEGDIHFVELECSDLLPLGCIFNTTDGDAAWETMNALVISVEEDTATGSTHVRFGPPLMLGFQDMMEIIRANEGVRPSYQLSQRTDGNTASAASVSETKHAGSKSNSRPPSPPGGPGTPQPWDVSFRNLNAGGTGGGNWQYKVNPQSIIRQINNEQLLVTHVDGAWYAIDNSKTLVWIEGTVISYTTTSSATIMLGSPGDFDQYGSDWTATGPTSDDGGSPASQTKWRKAIATIDWTSGSPVATNLVGANLQIFLTARAYLPACYPY